MGWLVLWCVCVLLGIVLLMPLRVQFSVTGRTWHVVIRYGCFRIAERGSGISRKKTTRRRTKSPAKEDHSAAEEDHPTTESTTSTRPEPMPEADADRAADDVTEEAEIPDASPAPQKKSFFQKIKPTNLSEGLDFLSDAIASLSPPLRFLARHLHLVKLRLELVVATDDAAKTAVTYGALSSAAYVLLGQMQACFDVRVEQISVRADFLGDQVTASAAGELHATPFSLLSVLLGAAVQFLWRSWRRIRRQEREQRNSQRLANAGAKTELL